VLSGTPGGVIFGFGNFWRGGAYLQPEDVVISRASGLGVLRSRIVAEAR
jgi:2-keto-4-pentenoate hydratase/2-oxohepta-3-ene-1,7-dioic acid hydratase in catechol pathway